jgi:lipooligosaccharide transport system permease protein
MTLAEARTRTSAWRVVEYHLVNARRYLSTAVILSLLIPVVYVLALGVGLGVLVDRNGTGTLGVPYLAFVAPGLLAAVTMQTAINDAASLVMAGFKWVRVFHGMSATPLTARQVCDGTLGFIALRLTVNAVLYVAMMACLGAARRWQIVLAVPAAVFAAMSFAAPIAAVIASIENERNVFNVLFRFVATPMFLFSGTFYPVSRLPEWGRVLAAVSPLWHGTELARAAALGGGSARGTLGHVLYLLVWLAVGLPLARWRFRVRAYR